MSTELDAAAILREHVLAGGTYWDHENKTMFATCQCGARCYLVNRHPDHADHLASLLSPRTTPASMDPRMTWTIDAHNNRIHHADETAATRYALHRSRQIGGEVAVVGCLCGSEPNAWCWICNPVNPFTQEPTEETP
jgi:hypothetical protein